MNTTGKIITAGLAGAAVGAVAALLLAPASGKETREKIKGALASAKDKVNDLTGRGTPQTQKDEVKKAQG